MGNKKTYQIAQIVKYSQKLEQKGFGANHDGNISVRFEDVLLATPTAVSKGDVVPEIVITLDMQGNKIEGLGKPFSEIKLHLAAYNARPDVKAVVHAHPPYATARGLLSLPIIPSLPEAIISIGDMVPVLEFAMPGDPRNENILTQALLKYNVMMLPGNGVLAVGNCIEQAYLRLELVEHLAKIDHYSRQMQAMNLGSPLELSSENISKLMEKHLAVGLSPKTLNVNKEQVNKIAFVPSNPTNPTIDSTTIDKLTALIIDKLTNPNQ